MAIILFINLKGGVSKTTSSVAVAETFANAGKKVLLIDADHQCTAGELLLGENRMLKCEKRKKTLHDLLIALLDDDFNPNQLETFTEKLGSNINGVMENLEVLPCSIRIDDFMTNVAKAKRGYQTSTEFTAIFNRRKSMLKNWLNSNYEYVIVDCPPSVAVQVKVLLAVADGYIIPSIPDSLSIRGCYSLIDRIRRTGIKTQPLGILWSLFRKQDKIHRDNVLASKNKKGVFKTLPTAFKTVIPNAAPIAKAFQSYQSFRSHTAKYTTNGSKLFNQLCDEIDRLAEKEIKTKTNVQKWKVW